MSETDLKQLCRICLSYCSPCSNIFVGRSSDEDPIYEVINYVYDLGISIDDGLPEYVCQECLGLINEFGNYKRNAHRAKKELLLLKEKKNVFIKVEEEDGSDAEVTEDVHIHEPQIEIYESGKNSPKGEEVENSLISNDIQVTQKREMDLCEDAGSIQTSSWLRDASYHHINYMEYHNSERICDSGETEMKQELEEEKNWLEEENDSSLNDNSGFMDLRRVEIMKLDRCKRNIGAEEEAIKNEEYNEAIVKAADVGGVNEEQSFSCHHCGEKRRSKTELKEHINRIHPTVFIDKGIEDSNGECKKTSFKCTFCQKIFLAKSSLHRHIKNHSGEKPFQCHLCHYKTSNSYNLKTHMLMHTGEKPFKCYICEYTTSYSSGLKTHILIHKGEKPFKCDICEYSTAVRSNLKAHMYTHTGEKQFKCSICNHCVKTRYGFRKHMLMHK